MKFVQSSSTSYSVCRELRKELQTQAIEWFRVLRINVVISPTTKRNQIYLLSKVRTWNDWLRLTMIHWYLPETAFAITHLELERMANKFGTDKVITAQVILSSEPEMINYFLDSSAEFATEREIFGFIHRPFQFEHFHYKVLDPRKPKKKVFRRGYNDHGSRRLPHEQHEAKFDYLFTEEQNRIEEERQAQIDATEIVKGWIQ